MTVHRVDTLCARFTTPTLALLPQVTCATLPSRHSCLDIDLISPKVRTDRSKKKKKENKTKQTNKQTFHFHRPHVHADMDPFLKVRG